MKKRLFLIVLFLVTCGVPPRQKALKILQTGINDQSMIVRIAVAKGLAQLGDSSGLSTIYDMLASDSQEAVVAAIDALYDLGESKLAPVVIKLSESEDPLTRTEAYRLIAAISDKQGLDILVRGTKDKIPKIRKIAYLGLGKFKDKKLMLNGLRDIDPVVRVGASQALGGLGEKGMADYIKRQMQKPDLEIQIEGIMALAKIRDTTAITFIKELLNDTPWDLRITAAEALLMFGDNAGVEVVKLGLRARDPFIRIEAARIFRDYRIPNALEFLRTAVNDEYTNVAVGAIEALVTYQAERKLFEELMDRSTPAIKIAAAIAYLKSTSAE